MHSSWRPSNRSSPGASRRGHVCAGRRSKVSRTDARTDALIASVCIGRPQYDLKEVAALMTELAHIAGSAIVLPYQPLPSECPPELPLEEQNGKIFPSAEEQEYQVRDFLTS